MNMYSIGELVDKLVIENIKIFNLREELQTTNLSSDEYVKTENKMNTINENRSTIILFLNKKIEQVIAGKEKNSYFKDVKTYEH